MDDMEEAPIPAETAGLLRYLKVLVSALAVTMIVGLIILITLVVMRFNQPVTVSFPESIALPDGAQANAVTRADGLLLVVTTDGRLLVFDPDGQTLRQEIPLNTD